MENRQRSVQCFNIMRNVNENVIDHLRLCMEYARVAMAESNEAPFLKILCIIRDWSWPAKRHTAEMCKLRQKIKSSCSIVSMHI